MSDTIKVRFLRPFRAYCVGDVVEMYRGQATEWARHGVVEPYVEQPRPLLETAALEPGDVERADATPRRKRR
jgi:hypothetical protein